MSASVSGLSKRYGSTLALDDVTLDIPDGHVHALLGHNGAGKSTLIKCLGGGTRPSAGSITIDGRPYDALTPRESIDAGIAVIYQHLSVIEGLTVAENLFLGQERTRAGLVRRAHQRELTRAALERVGGGAIDPDALVGALPIGQRQLVEIAKALQREARLLILDEPTAALSKAEAEQLGELVLELKRSGIAILYVTHLLGEVVRLADSATVLRNGAVAWTSDRSGISRESLVAAISDGHGAQNDRPAPPRTGEPAALELTGVTTPGVGPVTARVLPGEIVACYGLIGSGRTRLFNAVFGRHPIQSGTIAVAGREVRVHSPATALRAGIALVPGDRAREGLFGSLSALDNTVVEAMRRLSRTGLRSLSAERRVFDGVARWLGLKPLDTDLPAGRFSGGNQQKILLGRWVNDAAGTKVLLLDDPTQGVDVGARKDIYDAIKALAAERGVGVLVATNEPEEAVDLAHRCLLFREGRVVAEYDMADMTADALLAVVHGAPASRPDRPEGNPRHA